MNTGLTIFTFSTAIAALFHPLVSHGSFLMVPSASVLEHWEQERVSCNLLVMQGDRLQKVCQRR
ncbi:hypothetical protein [Roseofilum casamattae]|uniref:Secreted protein n=1 Tax=Roseofilum casamattae BLCC-M143 TaxID=3022442 RepID=A0ABT7BUA1_9CYAN|nr:hypothetical protein [Roseofilum casamattae]MDJ1182761.1 hypothetical protein [Roseofilum casamattae BLCC-M143]